MYMKIAMRNVKKSFRDFLIYFLTLMFSVCLFYTFNSFQAQQEMMVLNASQDTMMQSVSIFMMILSVFIVLILAFLILYANNFLIRRRKKEFGLYMLLGMPNQDISKILVFETACIGVVSLISGLFLGICFSQLLAIITARMLEVSVNYHFIFSFSTLLWTIIAFSSIFLFLMFFNARIMRRQKLIELLSANKKQEKQRLQSLPLSVILFIISCAMLATAYYLATSSLLTFAQFMAPILIIGALGTLLFFFSLSGFLLRFIKTNKNLYLRNLNMFVLRQIHARINTNFISMSAVCLMLLLSIGALGTGWNLNTSMALMYERTTPYDMSVSMSGDDPESLDTLQYDASVLKQEHRYNIYEADRSLSDFYAIMDQSKAMAAKMFDRPFPYEVIGYSDYVAFCEQNNMIPKALDDHSYLLITSMLDNLDYLLTLPPHAPITVYGQPFTLAKEAFLLTPYNEASAIAMATVIIQDEFIPEDAQISMRYWNMDFNDPQQILPFQQHLDEQLKDFPPGNSWRTLTRDDVYSNMVSIGVLFTYIGLYLGIVFLMASAVILALQQLSEADENRQRYEILRKIGVEKNMMHRAIFLQIAIYFLLPLGLAVIHSYFGIQAVTGAFSMVFDTGDLLTTSLMTGGVIILIYGSYFLITVQGYKQILFHRS